MKYVRYHPSIKIVRKLNEFVKSWDQSKDSKIKMRVQVMSGGLASKCIEHKAHPRWISALSPETEMGSQVRSRNLAQTLLSYELSHDRSAQFCKISTRENNLSCLRARVQHARGQVSGRHPSSRAPNAPGKRNTQKGGGKRLSSEIIIHLQQSPKDKIGVLLLDFEGRSSLFFFSLPGTQQPPKSSSLINSGRMTCKWGRHLVS